MEFNHENLREEFLVGSYSSPASSVRVEFMERLPGIFKEAVDMNSGCPDLDKISGLTSGEKEYYARQFSTLTSFDEVDAITEAHGLGEEDMFENAKEERAMKISNYVNALLLGFKIYATVTSGSLGVAASTMDSLFDFIAGIILWLTHLAMKNVDIYKYPVGKSRVHPVGIIIFATVMATIGFGVLVEGAEQLFEDKASEYLSSKQLLWLYTIMISATLLKLVLWIYCRSSKNEIVQAYAKDHYFDVLTNIVGLVAAVLGEKVFWWIDPAGAIILALYTITNWSSMVLENAVSVVGLSAEPGLLQKLIYVVMKDPDVKKIKTIRAYTFGVKYFVEVEVALSNDLTLGHGRKIGSKLRIQIERLPEVERAFVSFDSE